MDLAAGWATSISRKIALPSLVNLREISISTYVKGPGCNQRWERTRYRPLDRGSVNHRTASSVSETISQRVFFHKLLTIFNIAFGPKHVRITSATVFAAVILETCALRPLWRWAEGASVKRNIAVRIGMGVESRSK